MGEQPTPPPLQRTQELQNWQPKSNHWEHAIGAIIACLVRVGIEGRAISVNDSEVLGLPLRAGRIGIPEGSRKHPAPVRFGSLKRRTQLTQVLSSLLGGPRPAGGPAHKYPEGPDPLAAWERPAELLRRGPVNRSPVIRPKAGPGAHPDPRGSARPGYPSEAEWGVRSASGDDDPYGGHLRHVFQLLERQNLQGAAGRLGLHVHRLTRPERIRHVLPGPLRGLLHDLDLHQAGYRASADGPLSGHGAL